MSDAHSGDLNCVDWSPLDKNYVLTGSQDTTLVLHDMRVMGSKSQASILKRLHGHAAPVMGVQWCPHRANFFASSGEDNTVLLWDTNRSSVWDGRGSVQLNPPPSPVAGAGAGAGAGAKAGDAAAGGGSGAGAASGGASAKDRASKRRKGAVPAAALDDPDPDAPSPYAVPPPQVVFRHAGHRAFVVDFQWCHDPADPWLLASVSDDSSIPDLGGGTLQTWRVLDLVFGLQSSTLDQLQEDLDADKDRDDP